MWETLQEGRSEGQAFAPPKKNNYLVPKPLFIGQACQLRATRALSTFTTVLRTGHQSTLTPPRGPYHCPTTLPWLLLPPSFPSRLGRFQPWSMGGRDPLGMALRVCAEWLRNMTGLPDGPRVGFPHTHSR